MLVIVLLTKILPVLVICLLQPCASGPASLRIIGGRDAQPDELPYVVRLEVSYPDAENITVRHHRNVCTGACLTPRWTLTAAHCIQGLDKLKYKLRAEKDVRSIVRYGFEARKNIRFSYIISTYTHPNYKDNMVQGKNVYDLVNDVSLLENEPITLTHYAKLSAMDRTALTGLSATLVGYGLTELNDEVKDTMTLGKPLQLAKVVIKSCDNTAGLYPPICISPRCSDDIELCPGDSGGPLLHSTGIVGVNSLSETICTDDHYDKNYDIGVITATSSFIQWISDVMTKENHTL